MTRTIPATIAALTALALSGQPSPARAQDAQFWDNQYGTQAQMLGGTVVGSPSDLSATYYNPAWIAVQTSPSILFTTRAAEYYAIKIKGSVDDYEAPFSDKVTSSPGFIAGQFRQNLAEDLVVAYTYLQKTKFEYKASGKLIDPNPVPSPGEDPWFSTENFRQINVSEQWLGVTFAKQIGDHTSLGITPFGILRSQSQRTNIILKAQDGEGEFSHIQFMDSMSFWHTRMLLKIGLALDYSPLTLGMTLTTPSVGLFGQGSVFRNNSISGFELDDGSGNNTYLAVNNQENLHSSYRSPLSVALGASYRWSNTGLHFTIEWFRGLGEQEVLQPSAFPAQSSGNTEEYHTSYDFQAVLNWGLGFEQVLKKDFAFFASFRSDYSALSDDSPTNVLISWWNLWHAGMGFYFNFMNIEFNTGAEFTFGDETTDRYSDHGWEEGEGIINPMEAKEISYRRIKFIIGFNLPFG